MRWLRTLHLQTLRDLRLLRGVFLAWFALSLAAAVASPWVNPQPLELICAANGVMKVVVKNADGNRDEGDVSVANGMPDCPLCATISAPPPAVQTAALPMQPLAYAHRSIPAAQHTVRSAAPLMAHAPPPLTDV